MASLASLASFGSVIVVTPFLSNNHSSLFRRNPWRCLSVSVTVTTSDSVSLSRPQFLSSPNPNPKPPSPSPSPSPSPKTTTTTSMIDSLGDVLHKAESLESPANQNISNSPATSSSSPSPPSSSSSRYSGNNSSTQKTKTLKSVWRKGDAVPSVQKVAEELPRKPKSSYPPKPLRPSPARPQQPELLSKPSVVPLQRPKPELKPEASLPAAVKKRGPILIDKFASKKPESSLPAAAAKKVDPRKAAAASVVLAPTKPGKGPSAGKFNRGKKSSPPGSRRRAVSDDGEIVDEDTSELSVSIPGTVRKGRKWSKASRKAARLQAARDAAPVKAEILEVPEKGMSIEELAYHLTIGEGEILGSLYAKGIKPDGVQTLDRDIVKMLCKEYDVEVIDADSVGVEEMAKKKKEFLDEGDLDKLEERPPVLTIMGHVDHGKTTLLDCIRKSKIASSEAGGITQGIGAYKVSVPIDGEMQTCVFLDTPGHEAFGAMRARGARVTDIAIIVVAADDGIRPQTKEAIAHAKAAGVPIVIAINKIDRDGANPERVMQELSSIGLMPEDWGGDIPMVQVSALKGENVNDLLETVMLVAELQELKANPDRSAKGTVIEAGLDKAKGPIATLIVQNGTLKRGDVVVCGESFGKVRALFDDDGKRVDEAGPSTPVQVIGLNNVPVSGDEFEVVGSLDVAREKAETRADSMRQERITIKAGDGRVTLSSLASAVQSGKLSGLDLHQLNIIMKVDVQGSIEAVRQALQSLPQDNVTLKFLLEATGDVSNSDVDLALASKAIILGFNVKAPGPVKSYADNKGVEIRLYRVIYELIDDVRNAMEGLLDPTEEQVPIGEAEVRAVFSSGSGRIAGCMVTEGKVVTGCGIRVLRKGKEIHVGVLESLRRVKENVKEVNNGLECGIGAEEFDDWEEGDQIVAFNSVQRRRTLEEASASIAAALEGTGV